MGKTKTSKQLERHFKGIANHRRIDILIEVSKRDGLTLQGISGILHCNFKTVSEHTRRLVNAGLLNKKYVGNSVVHSLSLYGREIVNFMKSFSSNVQH